MDNNEWKNHAIKFFIKQEKEYDEVYFKRDRVSIQQICARESFIEKCRWAVKILRSAE